MSESETPAPSVGGQRGTWRISLRGAPKVSIETWGSKVKVPDSFSSGSGGAGRVLDEARVRRLMRLASKTVAWDMVDSTR